MTMSGAQIKGLLVLSQCAFLLKALLYPMLTQPHAVLGVEALHGICFACMWQAAVSVPVFTIPTLLFALAACHLLPAGMALTAPSFCGLVVIIQLKPTG